MKDKLLGILEEIRPDVDFGKEEGLLTGEVLDSFDLVCLLSMLDEKLNIAIDIEDVTEENFDSYKKLCDYLEEKEML